MVCVYLYNCSPLQCCKSLHTYTVSGSILSRSLALQSCCCHQEVKVHVLCSRCQGGAAQLRHTPIKRSEFIFYQSMMERLEMRSNAHYKNFIGTKIPGKICGVPYPCLIYTVLKGNYVAWVLVYVCVFLLYKCD